jgi:NitT/TauT family transport system substrate-binding protein
MRKLITLCITLLTFAFAQTCPEPTGAVLNVGVLPVLNALPTYIAQQEGLFEQYGVNVNLVSVDSGRDRTIAMQAGQIDVGNSDAVAHVLQVAGGQEVKIVRHDTFTPDFRFFSIVAGAQSGIASVEDLIAALEADTAQIAISQNTLIEYLATAMLRDAGYEPEADDYTEVAAIPLRLELLAQGQVAAALLPEPLTTLATTLQGGTALLDDSALEFVPVTLSVNQNVIDERPGDVCAYLQAYDDAVALINADPEAYRQNDVRVPDPVRGTYTIPQFADFRVPSEVEMRQVLDWMLAAGLLEDAPAYEDLVDGQFVPAE